MGEKMEGLDKRVFVIIIVLLVINFSPEAFRLIRIYSNNPTIIDESLVKQAHIIKAIPPQDGILITDLIKVKGKYMDVYDSPIFSAISEHDVYYEHVNEFSGIDKIIDTRKRNVEKVVENMVNCKNSISAEQNIINIMRTSNNQYLLILKKNKCTQKFKKLKIVNQAGASVLYKL
jgi:hypothetical protein